MPGGFVVVSMAASNAHGTGIAHLPLIGKIVVLALMGGALFCTAKAALIMMDKR